MDVNLKGRTALVTGASRGIGRAIALSLAEAGADVAVNYRRDADAAQQTVKDIEALGRKAKAYSASVENWDEDVALVGAVAADFGGLSILVNNAGHAPRGKAIAETDLEEVERLLKVHTFAPYYLSKLAIPHMRKEARGDVIIISSMATIDFPAGGGGYNMGKAAAEALAFTIAKEERQHGIRANVVAPGLTVTDMATRMVRATGRGDIHDLDASSPFGRVSVPEDVAATVTWMVSSANPYVNGQKLYVDGGG